MTTPGTPLPTSSSHSRQPSLRARLPRAIGSIRSPAGRKSSTQISAIFVQASSPSSSTLGSGPTSEEALLKQLDGDGGRQIGLRSRQGSSATIRTMGTRRESATSLAIPEDPTLLEPAAGPSRPPINSSSLPVTLPEEDLPDSTPSLDTIGVLRGERRVNPKTSSSWLRWNSPAPSFPRSNPPSLSDKGKGKGKADGSPSEEQQGSQMDSIPFTLPEDSVRLPIRSMPDSASEPTILPPAPLPHRLKPPDRDPTSTLSQQPSKRSWFGWTSPPSLVPEALHESNTYDPKKAPEPASPSPLRPSPPTLPTVPVFAPETSSDEATSSSGALQSSVGLELPPSKEVERVPVFGNEADVKTAVSSGWRWYSWGVAAVVEQTTDVKVNPEVETPDAAHANGITSVLKGDADASGDEDVVTLAPSALLPQQLIPDPTPFLPEPPNKPIPASQPGWGSYFYPFVMPKPEVFDPTIAPKAGDATSDSTSTTSRPLISPSTVPSAPLAVPSTASPAPTIKHIETTPTVTPGSSRKPDQARPRQGSTASTSGWLAYLAFRASQKKIANPSTTSIKSGKQRKSAEMGEEIMDFSSDPDFPSTEGTKVDAGSKSGTETGAKSLAAGGKDAEGKINGHVLTTSKSATSLVRERKLSSTSSRSELQPIIPSSPGKSPATPSSKNKAKSALPPAPAPPAVQPNLVIPSFHTTFSRPPRSLPPSTAKSGTASAFAWKAIDAMSSYVYGDTPGAMDMRGTRAARGIGDDLPRRIVNDEGWKNVRRIAVIGVHGW